MEQYDADKGKERYTFSKELLIDHSETKSNVKHNKDWAATNDWQLWLVATLRLEQGISRRGGSAKNRAVHIFSFVSNATHRRETTIYNMKGRATRHIYASCKNKKMALWDFNGKHKLIYYPDKRKRKLENILKMEEVQVPKYSSYVGHGYMQHKEDGW